MRLRFNLYYIVVFWGLGIGLLCAQEPSYRIIGEEELSGIDIYSMFQDSAHNIWLGSSRSLIRYDGYEFKHFFNSSQKRKSLFGLTSNQAGTLFCFNLSGQIFKLEQDSLHLYYELPDTLLSHDMNMYFDNNDILHISTKRLLILSPSLDLTILGKNVSSFINQNDQKDIIVHYINADSAFIWDKDQFNFACKLPDDNLDFIFFALDANWFGLDILHSTLYKKVGTNLKKIRTFPFAKENVSYRYSAKDKIFYTDNTGGGYVSTTEGNLLYKDNKILKSYRIGKLLLDQEKSTWIGTLGKGLLFIPNLAVTTYKHPENQEGETPVRLTYGQNGKLYVGSSSGQIYSLLDDGKLSPFLQTSLPIVFLKYIEETNQLFSSTSIQGRLFNILDETIYPKPISTIKDLCLINKDSQTVLISSRSGTCQYNLKSLSMKMLTYTRTNCAYYDPKNQLTWIGLTNKLFSIKDGLSKDFERNSTATSIVGDSLYTWIGSNSNGIFQLEGTKVLNKIGTTEGLHSNNIKKLLLKGDLLYIAHDKGIQIYNIATKFIKTINTTDGLLSNNIIDFDVYGQELSLITNKGLQQLQLDAILPNLTAPYLELSNILVNDSSWSKTVHDLNYDQNQITFQFKAKAYRHQNSLSYFYKLDKVDKDWVKTSYSNNQAKYPFLPAGKYTFRVKAVNENGISSPTVSYGFCIHPPFWQTWWFYLIVSGSLVAGVSWYYRRRAKKQRLEHQQKQELLSSKLTALKSQMNPHFIFNALNSIQALIVTEQPEAAYTYIVKFSNLVRNTLNYSDKDMLDIEDEIKLLELYLELEKLRFRKDFEYSISKNGLEGIQIPPMLIQPFVENAIKHGLLHKKGHKSLQITFEKKESLICTIVDNGIGRKQAQAIKDRQAKAYESFSVQSTNSRFKILQEIYMGDLGFRYEDLEENGLATGTKVVLHIPFEQMY